MKKKLIILAMCAALVLSVAACSAKEEPKKDNTTPPADQDSAEEEEKLPEEPPKPEEEDKTEAQGVAYENKELGFKTMLPPVMENSMETETTTQEYNGETITTLTFYYVGEADKYNVLSLDFMSPAAWEAIQAEGGPHGTYLEVSTEEQVVLMNGLQANPAKDGSADAEKIDQFQNERSIMIENFAFIAAEK